MSREALRPRGIWDPAFAAGLQPCDTCSSARGQRGATTPYDVPRLWQDVKTAIVKSLLMVLPDLREFDGQHDFAFLPRRFQLLSYDILVDDTGAVAVIEVNADGYVKGGLQKVRHPQWGDGFEFTKAMLELVGVRGYARSGYQGRLEELVASFCSNPRRARPC